ncbi:Hypothetical protein c3631 [Escherichia coli CFT073]|uniref:Uncharacterized protein n=1 Tax=Escherichia coli O6:H1 (strain CFT073 / ATCC 700928 / UPEC) TaxID=199310 RepID=A0A0H2VAU8_ECOL6|nr:Hypothetical protein c3631 [Escherichia coli CFT073]
MVSKKMRSLSKSLMPSAVDKKSLTMPDNPLMMVSGDGGRHWLFLPCYTGLALYV